MTETTGLQLHIGEELDDELEYAHTDLADVFRSNRENIREYMNAIKSDMANLVALENFAGEILQKPAVTEDDANRYDQIVNNFANPSLIGMQYQSVATESFGTLLATASTVAQTASNTTNQAIVAASLIKDGLVAGAKLAQMLYERVQQGIVKLAASWDFICGMIEKRWLGLAQLVDVYDLQHEKLMEKFDQVLVHPKALATFKVQLYVAKLRNDGRDIRNKAVMLQAINDDCVGVSDLGESFIKQLGEIKKVDIIASQAFKLKYPYKNALIENLNTVNNLLKTMTHNTLFSHGGFVKSYEAQSRVLLGGKVVYIGYNQDDLPAESPRKEVRGFIANMNFASVKRRDGASNDTETVEFAELTVPDAQAIFEGVRMTNETLRTYFDSGIPEMLRKRTAISDLIKFATGLTGGNAAFETIKSFFSFEGNLKAFNLVAPAGISKLLGMFLGASSFAIFSGMVAASAAAITIDFLRKYIMANLFSMMELQFKLTDVIEKFDHDFVDTIIEVHNQGYRVCKKLASTRNWEFA
jgi:hypothetical protein